MIWECGTTMEILMAICFFSIQIGGYTTIFKADIKIQKYYFFCDDSSINLRLGRNWFSFCIDFFKFYFSMRPYKKDVHRQYSTAKINGWRSWVLRKSVSVLSMQVKVYGGANLVPTAVPEICCLPVINFKQIIFQNKFS